MEQRTIKFRAKYKDKIVSVMTMPESEMKRGAGIYKVNGYVFRRVIGHPLASKRGYVQEHRLVMEEHLGRILEPRIELVHHIDGNRSNNVLSNLKLISPSEHPRGHIGERNPNGQFVAIEPIFSEIKFRLLNTNTGECRPYTLCELISKTYRKGSFKFRGRFTGLLDKNGKEIYEGDGMAILFGKFDGEGHLTGEDYSYPANEVRIVKWNEEKLQWYCGDKPLSEEVKYLYVVENIYENPELLEKANGKEAKDDR